MSVTIADIRRAYGPISKVALLTPVLPVKYESGGRVFLKCENLQLGGAFKIRGAYNKIRSLGKRARDQGIVTYSSGNHAQGAALAARLLGVRATVVMLDTSLPNKIERTKRFGGEVILGGTSSEEIRRRAEDLARERGAEVVRPFDDPAIIAGQGSVGLEIVQQRPDVAAVVVPIGGGGLISGVATAVKGLKPRVKVYGVEPEGAAKVTASLSAGRLVTLPGTNTVADGLKPVRAGEITFPVIQRLVDAVVTVSDDEILDACRHLILEEKVLAEPSGAASFAAVRCGKVPLPRSGAVVCVVSGGNAELKSILA